MAIGREMGSGGPVRPNRRRRPTRPGGRGGQRSRRVRWRRGSCGCRADRATRCDQRAVAARRGSSRDHDRPSRSSPVAASRKRGPPSRRERSRRLPALRRSMPSRQHVGCRIRPGRRSDRPSVEHLAARVARHLRGGGAPAAPVLDEQGLVAGAVDPLVAPLAQRRHDRPQGAALVGEEVVVAAAGLVVGTALEDAGVDEGVEPVGRARCGRSRGARRSRRTGGCRGTSRAGSAGSTTRPRSRATGRSSSSCRRTTPSACAPR